MVSTTVRRFSRHINNVVGWTGVLVSSAVTRSHQLSSGVHTSPGGATIPYCSYNTSAVMHLTVSIASSCSGGSRTKLGGSSGMTVVITNSRPLRSGDYSLKRYVGRLSQDAFSIFSRVVSNGGTTPFPRLANVFSALSTIVRTLRNLIPLHF